MSEASSDPKSTPAMKAEEVEEVAEGQELTNKYLRGE